MFELSDYIVGIYKVKDCTDSVTIKNECGITNTQNQRILTQQTGEPNKTLLMPASTSQICLDDEQIAQPQPETTPHRDTTFSPQIESTALSEVFAIHNHNNATCLTDQDMDVSNYSVKSTVESAEMERKNQSRTISNQSSINETLFKKPLPPPLQKATT